MCHRPLLAQEKDKENDDRQGNAQKPKKNTATHLNLHLSVNALIACDLELSVREDVPLAAG
jgi:hypothetical protein